MVTLCAAVPANTEGSKSVEPRPVATVCFWKAFDADLMPDAMALVAKVARKLVNKIEAYRNAPSVTE